MRVIVTRPQHDAARWVADLQARGFQAEALPLIDIAASAPQPVRSAWAGLGRYQAVMFVSGNAVHHFFAQRPTPAAASQSLFTPAAPPARAWATGPGTLAALRRAGVAAAAIDAPDAAAGQFDSESLWQIARAQVRPGSRVLIVRGGDLNGQGAGRNWFADQLTASGAQADFVVAYERRPPLWNAAHTALAQQAARDGSVWLLSSSEAVGYLAQRLPAPQLADARAIATHPRIAQAAREAGFGVVCESRPTLDDVVASIESLA